MKKQFKTGLIWKLSPKTRKSTRKRKELKCSKCGDGHLNVFSYPDRIIIDCNDCGTLWQILWDRSPRLKHARTHP